MKQAFFSRISKTWTVVGALFLGALTFIAFSCKSEAEKQMEKPSGEELYVSYCLICHGDDGKGNGTMAELLKTPPPDLTQISARRGGTFPTEEIHQFIDGRIEVPGHGRGEMPVWGATFKASEHLNNEAEVSARIDELVKYLKNLQQ